MIPNESLKKAIENKKSFQANPSFGRAMKEFDQSLTAINAYRGRKGLEAIVLNEKSAIEFVDTCSEIMMENRKAITGVDAANGLGLAGVESNPLGPILDVRGGGYAASGFVVKTNAAKNSEFPYYSNLGRFQSTASGTSTTNEITAGKGGTALITAYRYIAEVDIYDDVEAAYPASGATAAQLVNMFKAYLAEAKTVAEDEEVTLNLAVNDSIASVLLSIAPDSPIALTIAKAISQLSKYKAKASGKKVVYLGETTLYRLFQESDKQGQFQGIKHATTFAVDLNVDSGICGHFMGATLVKISTLDETAYDVDGAGVVQVASTLTNGITRNTPAVPAGNGNNLIFVGYNKLGGIHRSLPEKDRVNVFDGKDIASFRTGQEILGAECYRGGNAINPVGWRKIALPIV